MFYLSMFPASKLMYKYLMIKIIRRTQTGMTYCQRNPNYANYKKVDIKI